MVNEENPLESAPNIEHDGEPVQANEEGQPESEFDQLKAERDKLREQLLRTAADFDNFRKRTRRELEDAKVKGQQDVVRDLLPVFDNLERAVQAAQTATDATSVVEGVRMVLKLFEDTAERMGLLRVKSVGERFDPAVHEAIQQRESDEAAPGTILTEVVPGYRFGEKLVRAAMVVVARKPAAAAEPASKAASQPPGAEANPATTKPSTSAPPASSESGGDGQGA